MISEKISVDDQFATQAADIEAMLERTAFTLDEAAGRLDVRPETLRKYREGYQRAGRQFMARVRALQSPASRAAEKLLKEKPLSYDPTKVKAAIDYILENGDRVEISIFLALIHATEKEVFSRRKPE